MRMRTVEKLIVVLCWLLGTVWMADFQVVPFIGDDLSNPFAKVPFLLFVSAVFGGLGGACLFGWPLSGLARWYWVDIYPRSPCK